MPELEVNPALRDKTPVFTDPKNAEAAMKAVNDMLHSLSFFKTLIAQNPQVSDVFTHIRLLEYNLADLSKAVKYEGIVAGEVERRHAEIRAANLRIHELEGQLGKGATADMLTAGLRRYDRLFRAWYEAHGLHYGDIKLYELGLSADIGHDINNKPLEKAHIADEEAYQAALRAHGQEFIATCGKYDIEQDRRHSRLLDTDRNREQLKAMYTSAFPGARINGFKSHRDDKQYFMDHQVFVFYTDIEAWAAKILGNKSKN